MQEEPPLILGLSAKLFGLSLVLARFSPCFAVQQIARRHSRKRGRRTADFLRNGWYALRRFVRALMKLNPHKQMQTLFHDAVL